jgi:hypothetical protein
MFQFSFNAPLGAFTNSYVATFFKPRFTNIRHFSSTDSSAQNSSKTLEQLPSSSTLPFLPQQKVVVASSSYFHLGVMAHGIIFSRINVYDEAVIPP